jgi:hypothetical protein
MLDLKSVSANWHLMRELLARAAYGKKLHLRA